MNKQENIVAIVPARGGSKRLPGKNTKLIAGKPMISWVLEAALRSRYIQRVIVSTDDELIAAVAKKVGAEVPFMRPHKLSTDTAKAIDVIQHAVTFLEQEAKSVYNTIVVLQPTSPLVTTEDIDGTIETFLASRTQSATSITPITERPEWMYTLQENSIVPYIGKSDERVRQELPTLYRLNGAVYVSTRDCIMNEGVLVHPKDSAGYVMPRECSIDIDEQFDFEIAEMLLKRRLDK